MLSKIPIRWRLTGWYFLSAAVIGLFMGLGSWYEMRLSLLDAIDTDLEHRIRNFSGALSEHPVRTPEEVRSVLAREANGIAGGGDFEAFTLDGRLIYQGTHLANLHVPSTAPRSNGEVLVKRTVHTDLAPVRFVSRAVSVGTCTFILEQGEPLSVQYTSLRSFSRSILIWVIIFLTLGSISSYWISRRALDPVYTIIKDARRINVQNVSERLTLPDANDELHLLSETLNAMLERIAVAMAQIRQFTADASHELRSPLTLIRTAAEHSLMRERSPEEMVAAMRRIERETLHTTDLLNDLLLLARTEGHLMRDVLMPLNLVEIVEETVQRISPVSQGKQQSLYYDAPVHPIVIEGDPDLLGRLVLILVDNAVKYTPEGGSITITTETSEGMACLRVCDNGEGIAAEDLPYVFDRFWRADKVRSRKHGGSGLGLSIAQKIVEQYQGCIRAESEPGSGACFSVYLKLSAI